MKQSFSIKLWDGIKVITEDETITVKMPVDLWELFGWDIENDPAAKECSIEITKHLLCFGKIDLTPMNNGKLLYLVTIPATESEAASNE